MTSRSGLSSRCPEERLAQAHREEWGRLLAQLAAGTRRLDLAEDALAEAFARAAERWPVEGVPANVGGWLYTTARRQVISRIRSEAVAGRKAPLLAVDPVAEPRDADRSEWPDDRLELILLCCHPALPEVVRPALALRLVIGTTTEQIARLFLVATSTMAARLTRAKKKIVVSGIPLTRPVGEELQTRLDGVCRTIYLAFTAGYSPGEGADLLRVDVAGDAARLAAILHELVPDAPQVRALRSLILLQHSRRDARVSRGVLVTLPEQDRRLWHRGEIDEAKRLLESVPRGSGYGEELRLQALIASQHADAPSAAGTDWVRIEALYEELEVLTVSPVVRLNRAVAAAEVAGPRRGLELLSGLDAQLAGNHRLHAVRGDLAERSGDVDVARESFAAAVALCGNDVESAHLRGRLASLAAKCATPGRDGAAPG